MLSLYDVYRAGVLFLRIIETAIVVYCVLSWFQPRFRAFELLRRFIQPFISPFRRLSARVMRHFGAPVDFTCVFAIIAFHIIGYAWRWLFIIISRLMR